MKNPIVIAALIISVALVICTWIVMQPVYSCIGDGTNAGKTIVCIHGQKNN